jgi:hypothetical protein
MTVPTAVERVELFAALEPLCALLHVDLASVYGFDISPTSIDFFMTATADDKNAVPGPGPQEESQLVWPVSVDIVNTKPTWMIDGVES